VRRKAALQQAIQTLQELNAARNRLRKIKKHLELAQYHVNQILQEMP
jgi:hypothetical protein